MTRVQVALLGAGVPGLDEWTLAEIISADEPVLNADDPDRIRTYGTLDDLHGAPALLVYLDEPKSISKAGATSIRSARFSTLSASVLILFVIVVMLQRIVVRPLSQLRDHAIDIRSSGDTARRVGMQRGDEIGQLADEFDSMLEQLEESRQENVDIARSAGMSQVATGILHNVGSVMNSVNVTAKQLGRMVGRWRVQDLEKVLAELRRHEGRLDAYLAEDPKGRHLLDFLEAYLVDSSKRKSELLLEVDSLASGLGGVLELIGDQEKVSQGGSLEEWVAVEDVFRQSIELVRGSRDVPFDIQAVWSADLPRVKLDSHRLRQIVTSLVLNAFESLERSGGERLELRAAIEDGQLRVEIEDGGAGFEAGEDTRLFQYGFTTKPDGEGRGLHLAGNAATEMGGILAGRSEGPGLGATFVLTVPVRSTSCTLQEA